MKTHPVSDIFPPMTDAEYAALKADIEANGQREKVWTFKGALIDGRHRERACRELGLECKTREWDGDESQLTDFIVSLNLHRRHLNESQRALIAARIARVGVGGDRRSKAYKDALDRQITVAKAANLLNVGELTVAKARAILHRGDESQIRAIEEGRATVGRITRHNRNPLKVSAEPSTRKNTRLHKDKPWSVDTPRKKALAVGQKNRMIRALSGADGLCIGLGELDIQMILSVCDAAEIKTWIRTGREAARRIREFSMRLESGNTYVNEAA